MMGTKMIASALVGLVALPALRSIPAAHQRAGRLILSTAPDTTLQALFDPPQLRQSWNFRARTNLMTGTDLPLVPPMTSAGEVEWLGADCATTLRFPSRGPNATLWLFGDTLLGRTGAQRLREQRGCFMPHQVRVHRRLQHNLLKV